MNAVSAQNEGLANYHFFVRKLHSFLGFFPISFFLTEHLITNSLAVVSPALYNSAVSRLQSIPFLPAIEFLFIALPLAIHALYGLYIVYVAKNNVLRYSYLRNWAFYLQRVTALVSLAFILVHVWQLRVAYALSGLAITFDTMSHLLANPWWLAFYVIGLLAAAFHFANGLWNLTVSWGIAVGEKAQEFIWKLCMGLFIIASCAGLAAIVAFIQ
ncbi:succinate dehydrogenase cytochrome b558 subunit [Desulforamulus hydrothermalis]|uniref:Succinate dehydrogenase cytochrome b558 subunit n=1 Tax=Desulforamulus hydrothermalis Lam5 = DSM 18033 TaxID=1121428 RepID=K8E6F6_9FIRM|nr:succinate dehydrogenase cytochrome b558 subunit [Desulforamulus hydrothermalis]CCO07063.1 Succinate dehydrogenase cytochrome b558 subunit [Desulforamulus hydrothermalis Lam5 = DSM 18033]SHH40484.1 succinate dehydrogenase subunit C [Desulforamulus hydrothermalis Lam5 = DSM 18033]